MDQDAAFGNLNACGGFLITSEVKQGRVAYVKIQSNAGQECRLVNPWPGAMVSLSSTRQPAARLSGALLKFATQPGETLVLIPQSN
jgi:hypothetical protein